MLGRACVRCGITDPLVWDHIEDDGHLHRRNGPNTRYVREPVWRVAATEFTKILTTGRSDRLQLLCPNCNHLKQFDRAAYNQPPTYGPRAA